ncbi:MAG: ankyrin repeat domain-containing protein [Alphaproteobacteria bacterium]|nr:ankyrin repeat domain-containing protein [Alphaproteobacteria bacterium]
MENSWKKVDKALIEATIEGNIEEVRSLLENGADVNTQDDKGWTPLMFAAKSQDVEMAKLLMENGADNEIRNEDGYKAIWYTKIASPTMKVIFEGVMKKAKKEKQNNVPPNINDGRY